MYFWEHILWNLSSLPSCYMRYSSDCIIIPCAYVFAETHSQWKLHSEYKYQPFWWCIWKRTLIRVNLTLVIVFEHSPPNAVSTLQSTLVNCELSSLKNMEIWKCCYLVWAARVAAMCRKQNLRCYIETWSAKSGFWLSDFGQFYSFSSRL